MITREPIRLEEHVAGEPDPTCGAVVVFTGVVRSPHAGRDVTGVSYECYEEMAERELASLLEELKAAHPVKELRVVHRIGELAVGEVSLLVIVTAAHRKEAFVAAAKTVDEIKRRVPIWKRERYVSGDSRWL